MISALKKPREELSSKDSSETDIKTTRKRRITSTDCFDKHGVTMEISALILSTITLIGSFWISNIIIKSQVRLGEPLTYSSTVFDCVDFPGEILGSKPRQTQTFAKNILDCLPPNINTPHPSISSVGYIQLITIAKRIER